MEAVAIVSAWTFGIVSGASVAIGVASAVSGRMVFNPTRIDWSVGEARALGIVFAGQGCLAGVLSLIEVLEWATYKPIVPPILMVLIGLAGLIGITWVGRHHDNRNPIKRWWP